MQVNREKHTFGWNEKWSTLENLLKKKLQKL